MIYIYISVLENRAPLLQVCVLLTELGIKLKMEMIMHCSTHRSSSIQSGDWLSHLGDMRDDSAEILFQSFLQGVLVNSSGMGRDVCCLMFSIQHLDLKAKDDVSQVWAVGRSFGLLQEGIRRSHPPWGPYPRQTSSEKKSLGHCRNSWSVRQKERTVKEMILTWKILNTRKWTTTSRGAWKRQKEHWIGEHCSETEENLRKNNSKRAYQLVKDLTTVIQREATMVQDSSGKNDRYWTVGQNTALSCTITRPVEIHQYWTVPRQTQRMTTPSFAKKCRLQYNHWRKGSQLESTTSQQNWFKQVERISSSLSQQSAIRSGSLENGQHLWPSP